MFNFDKYCTVYLKANRTCNLRCSHCYNINRQGEMSLEQLDYALNWIDRFIKYNNFYGISPIFHGGEPLIYKYKNKILDHWLLQKENNWDSDKNTWTNIGITTNLSLKEIDHDFLKKIDYIATSYDPIGIRWKNTEEYNIWMENCKQVNSYTDLAILITLTDKIINTPIDNFINTVNSWYCSIIKFNEVVPSNNPELNVSVDSDLVDKWLCQLWDKRNLVKYPNYYFNQLIESIKDNKPNNTRCGKCSSTSICIDINGDISVCPSSSFIYGNIYNDNPEDLINNKKLQRYKILERFKRRDCVYCKYFGSCNCGCFLQQDKCIFTKRLADKIKEYIDANTEH